MLLSYRQYPYYQNTTQLKTVTGVVDTINHTLRKKIFIWSVIGLAFLCTVLLLAASRASTPVVNHIDVPASDPHNNSINTPLDPQPQVTPQVKSTQQTDSGAAGTSSQTKNSSSTQVTVNGQNIAVPENGSVHESLPTENGQVSVDVDVHNSTSGDETTRQKKSTSLKVHSKSSTQINQSYSSTSTTP